MADAVPVLVTLGYIATWIVIGEVMHRLGVDRLVSRKTVHIGASGVIFIFAYMFESSEAALVTIVLITAIATADHTRGVFKGIGSPDPRNLGTVWFWVAMLLVVAVLWEEPRLMVAAVVPMAVGDPLAGLVGSIWGSRQYEIGSHVRTAEGSLAFVVSTFVLSVLVLLTVDGPPDVAVVTAVAAGTVLACVGAAIEAVSRWGIDNLSITAASVVLLMIVV